MTVEAEDTSNQSPDDYVEGDPPVDMPENEGHAEEATPEHQPTAEEAAVETGESVEVAAEAEAEVEGLEGAGESLAVSEGVEAPNESWEAEQTTNEENNEETNTAPAEEAAQEAGEYTEANTEVIATAEESEYAEPPTEEAHEAYGEDAAVGEQQGSEEQHDGEAVEAALAGLQEEILSNSRPASRAPSPEPTLSPDPENMQSPEHEPESLPPLEEEGSRDMPLSEQQSGEIPSPEPELETMPSPEPNFNPYPSETPDLSQARADEETPLATTQDATTMGDVVSEEGGSPQDTYQAEEAIMPSEALNTETGEVDSGFISGDDESFAIESPTEQTMGLESPDRGQDTGLQAEEGYASDDSFNAEVNQITGGGRDGVGGQHIGELVFYTRAGTAITPSEVDQCPDLLNSPRFREACKAEGMLMDELMRRPDANFEEKGLHPDKLRLRIEFYEKKRVEKAQIVLEKREKVIATKHVSAASPVAENSSMIEKEMRKNELKRNQMEKRNSMMKEYDIKIKRLRKERQERLEQQEKAAKKQKEDEQKETIRKEVVRFQRNQRKKAETEDRLREQEEMIIRRAKEMEEKAEANMRAVAERQTHEAKLRAEKRALTDKKIADCLIADQTILENKRNRYFQKQEYLKQRHADRQGERDQLEELNRLKQEQAAERRNAVKDRDMFLQEERLRKAAERDAKMEERNRELQRRRELEKERTKLLEERKEEKRAEIKRRDKAIQEKRRTDFFQASERAQERRDDFFEKRNHEIELRKEAAALAADEKQQFLERHKRIKSHDREQKLQKLRNDKDRVAKMVETKEELLENRKVQQRELWNNRVRVVEVTPGPGEYNPQRLHTMPAYKFGIKRKVERPKGEPGPGAYKPTMASSGQMVGNPGAARIGRGISKSALDWEIMRASKIPGPQDYLPTRPSSCPTVKFSRGNALSEFERHLINAAKLPGPMNYALPELDSGMEVGISKANPKGYLDWAIYRGKQLPGPQDYEVHLCADKVKQRAPTVKMGQGEPKNDVDWSIYRAASCPGPGEYEVDISFSSGPHGTKNSSKTRPDEARKAGSLAKKGIAPRVSRPHSGGARAVNVNLM